MPKSLRRGDTLHAEALSKGHLVVGTREIAFSGDPFALRQKDSSVADYLDGFQWIVDLAAGEVDETRSLARNWLALWLARGGRRQPGATSIRNTACRLTACLTTADVLVTDEPDNPVSYDDLMMLISDDLQLLAADWRSADLGRPQISALIAVLLAAVSLKDEDELLARFEHLLVAELKAQILDDGGHISRNANDVLEILVDLIPVLRTYQFMDRKPPAELSDVRNRMAQFLKTLRLGDHRLGRFNGSHAVCIASLSTVAKVESAAQAVSYAEPSGYIRLEARAVVVIADIGSGPPPSMATGAHAGALSFEMSDGSALLLANCSGRAAPDSGVQLRGTAAHNSLSVGALASADLSAIESSGRPSSETVRGPAVTVVDCTHGEAHDGVPQGGRWLARHDGYATHFGLIHERALELSPDGERVSGVDRLTGERTVRFAHDVPVALHFHLAAGIMPTFTGTPNQIEIATGNGNRWIFEAQGGHVFVEEVTRPPSDH